MQRLKRFLVVFLSCLLMPGVFSAVADDVDLGAEIIYKYKLIEELKKEIAQIDSENARCQKMKNGWIAATVIGGVGVAATGTAAIIQGVKLKDKPKTKKEVTKKEKEAGTESQDMDK